MLPKILIAPYAIALLSAGSGVAFAQAQAATTIGTGASPVDLSCADFAVLDQAQAPSVVYYIAGYNQGREGVLQQTGAADGASGQANAMSGGMAAATDTNATSPNSAGGAQPAAGGAASTLPGFANIDIAAITTACQASPQSMLSDVISSGGTAVNQEPTAYAGAPGGRRPPPLPFTSRSPI